MQWIKDIVTGLIETYGTRDITELLDYLENLSIDQLSSYFEIPKELLQYTLEKVI